mgnify:CR=1 FL=1
MNLITGEVQGPELSEAGQRPVVDLRDLVVAEDEDLEAGRRLERQGRDGLQVVVGQVEASQGGESEQINCFINIPTDIDVRFDSLIQRSLI